MGGGGRAQGGGRREGPRDAGGGGCRGSSRSGSSLLLAYSLSVPGAGYRARGGSQLPLLPGALKPLQLRGPGPCDWLARALGAPRKQVDVWVGSAGTRNLGALWLHWSRVWVAVQGRGLCSCKTNFPPAPWFARLLRPGPALEGEFGEGQKVDGWVCRSVLGSVRVVESPGVGRARVLRLQSGRSGRRLHVRGKRPDNRGAGVREKETASSAGIWGLLTGSHFRCAGIEPRTASSWPGNGHRALGRRAGPREPKPSLCHAQCGLTLFFSLSRLSTLSEGILDTLQSCGLHPETSLRPSSATPTPKVKREASHSSCTRGWLSRSS